MEYIGFDTIAAWYFGFGFFLWIVAQITRTDVTQGVVNNLGCLLLFVVYWPGLLWALYCWVRENIKKRYRVKVFSGGSLWIQR
ncbi:hypothetical protein ACYB9B_25785 [Klebsiella pneumoniae]|uniref:hypothetical protein n=1 Tax=Klebsiella pneumoniae TaxID=573 RepID=UPI000C7D465C|nr:hypothetical protein [Klebsiella pneumoniae]ELA2117831.1 hypothetical protein [Klebsiella pneumoniae]MBW5526967.1 hypothetical protein [Klebsiella pneumoniae]MCH0786289.1 hypothetical protein [Klebsiella pneumoniae]MCP6428556.1 hypothetical protein [Klebsiella pneumoniae]MCP6662986.1 hypothetical protein [Klebsiella pneumoniae]